MAKYQISTTAGDFEIEADGEPTPEALQSAAMDYYKSQQQAAPKEPTNANMPTGAQAFGRMMGIGLNGMYAQPQSQAELENNFNGYRRGTAAGTRIAGGILGSEGGPSGAAINGGAETLAQLIESGKVGKPGQIVQNSAIGAVPLGSGKGIIQTIKNALKMGAVGGAGEEARSLIDDGKGSDNLALATSVPAAITAVSPVLGAIIGKLTNNVTPEAKAAVEKAILNNANKDAVLASMKQRGAVVVPSAVNPSIKNQVLESIAGIQNVEGGVARKNQPVFNEIGREEANLAAKQPINEANLNSARSDIAKNSYEAAQQAGFGQELNNWRDAGTQLKKAQADLNKGFTNARGQAVDDAEKALANAEAELNRVANSPDAAKIVNDAKVRFAKNYDVGEAVASGTDEVRPGILSALLQQRGESGLSGGLRDIAQFNNAFGRSAKNPTKLASAPGAASAGAALIAGGGNPVQTAALTGGVPVIRGMIRDLLTSPAYQAKNAVRNYKPETSGDPALMAAIAKVIAQMQAQKMNEELKAKARP